MPVRNRSNPLALAVLVCLDERPMHPYEVGQTLRSRHKDESVRLNYGSLYAVVESLEKRGLIEASETERAGRLPERTVYRITDAGRLELHDWMAELVQVPTKQYPDFEAALSFLPVLKPEEAARLLKERVQTLELWVAGMDATAEVVAKAGLPRLFRVESDYARRMAETELDFARELAEQISGGDLDGLDWWHGIHAAQRTGDPFPSPFDTGWTHGTDGVGEETT